MKHFKLNQSNTYAFPDDGKFVMVAKGPYRNDISVEIQILIDQLQEKLKNFKDITKDSQYLAMMQTDDEIIIIKASSFKDDDNYTLEIFVTNTYKVACFSDVVF